MSMWWIRDAGGQTDIMRVRSVWLLAAVLVFSALQTLCDPLYVLSAPNLMRVGSPEKVFVEAQDYSGANVNVRISMRSAQGNGGELTGASVTLTPDKNYQDLVEIEVPGNAYTFQKGIQQYAFLQAHFPQKLLKKQVLLTFQSGHIFIQTDKTIYTPDSTVFYRVFSLSPGMSQAVESGVRVEILTPDGISLQSKSVYPDGGMTSGTFSLTDPASPGMWKLVAWHQGSPQQNFSSEFEVKEYVLPSFEVSLTPHKAFFYINDDSLSVDIESKYLFGQKVNGHAFAVFGVITEDKGKISLPGSLQRVMIWDGSGRAELKRKHILETFPNINQLVGHSLFVSVSVLTETGSEMVEAQKRGIQIVTSPYTIHFKSTPQFFKPGMPFDVLFYVTNPDQTPAVNMKVEVNPGGVRGQTKANGNAKVTINTPGGASTLDITVKTMDPQLQSEQQAVRKMTAHAYKPKAGSNNYLHVGIDAVELEIGDHMKVDLNTGKSPGVRDQDYTYMILSKGQILQVGRYKSRGQSVVSLSLPVTKVMVPSFRFVAYYHVGSNEVVSDSVWVDVKDTCMGSLKVEVRDPLNIYSPGEEFGLKLTGDPGAKVGLVAVDKGVYVLNNNNRLVQSKIWDVVEKQDTGCTAGSGREGMQVFGDAGLLFESSTAGGTGVRTHSDCPAPSVRRKREYNIMELIYTLVNKYSGLKRQCCVDGMLWVYGYSCLYRSKYIVDGQECKKAFLHCCNEVTNYQEAEAQAELTLARSEMEEFVNSDSIVTRTLFPESWLWEEVTLPKCPSLNPNCRTTSVSRNGIKLKDSITTWEITAISLSKTHGICVADVREMTVMKEFFVDLKIPYSAVRKEQIEIKAVIHNFYNRVVKVHVELKETKEVCSLASKKGRYQTTVTVDAKSSRSVPFVIVPLALGRHGIEVKAAVAGRGGDGVKKDLLVVSEGVLTKLGENLRLSPSKNGGQHVQVIKSLILKDQAPNTPAITYITATGDPISITIEKAISGATIGSLVVQPGGCGEQNMIRLTMPVIATHYLDQTNQWHTVSAGLRQTALTYITRGYNQQLAYRKGDGSYGAWINRPSSTWLTAYVAKVFAMASRVVHINQNVICSALRWLIMNKQQPNGVFVEHAPVIHGEMTGNVRGRDAQSSMTAFVLIALQEGRSICAASVPSLENSIHKATTYLNSQLQSLTNPYAVAMASYALANENSLNKQVLLRKASADGSHWPVPESIYFGLEASAYALLAFVKAKDFQRAAPILNWLSNQRQYNGGYGTTQATIIVFQAVAEYRIQVKDVKLLDMEMTIQVAGSQLPFVWRFNQENAHLTRTEKIPSNREITVIAKGSGEASVTVVTEYYAKAKERNTDCKNFELELMFDKENRVTYSGASESYKLTINTRYLSADRDATMSILDVSLLTGFVVDENDLKALSTGHGRIIQKFEMNKQLSERGSLIIYLDRISHEWKDKVTFRVHKVMKTGFLQPAAVTVYEYYSMENRCVKFYHPTRKQGALQKICHKDVCQCAEDSCSLQRKEKIDEARRNKKACEASIDYVFKAVLLNEDEDVSTVYYRMKIETSLKKGPEKDVVGRQRTFTVQLSCKEALDLKKGTGYLIMGHAEDVQLEGGNGQYALGERTWVEHWPSKDESETSAELKEKYNGMLSLQHDLLFDCPKT
ncbi:complement C3 [Triplophysa rosa]|uniref:Complement C3-like n=1 Tax=Triplophysa rosa TaxID=992332 RepID=A0A9W7WYV8_TRIRA|nr:complement C3 [Triplophysa rosa]KAI7810846.1 putative complement C3-like [Triplophysa rosa]